jgi:hypothetical protein
MRFAGLVLTITLHIVVPSSAQSQLAGFDPYGLDPYNPRDALLLRQYGATLVAQTPLLELRKLDPYRPSHAALLRQIGGAIPWGFVQCSAAPFPRVCGRSCTRGHSLRHGNAGSAATPLTDDSVSGSAHCARSDRAGTFTELTSTFVQEGGEEECAC